MRHMTWWIGGFRSTSLCLGGSGSLQLLAELSNRYMTRPKSAAKVQSKKMAHHNFWYNYGAICNVLSMSRLSNKM